MSFPSRIICLTEESVETLHLLGREDLIVGISEYAERPPEAKKLPVVTQFIRSDIEKIVSMRPDLVLGFSDLQKDIASQLIGRGLNVFVTNQRSLEEILGNILLLGRMVGENERALELVQGFRQKLEAFIQKGRALKRHPRVYFEEWDHPHYSAIQWVSELIEATGGVNVFAHKTSAMARDRQVTAEEIIMARPEIIFPCWCGKKVKLDSIYERPGFEAVPATQNKFIWELDPAVFLQPGPALFLDGLDQMFAHIEKVANLDV